MKFALWLLGLFAVATAAALFAGDNPGTVSVFFPPHRLDVSLNLALLALVGLLLVVHLALTSLRALLGLPLAAKQWRKHHRERAALQAMANGTAHFLAGRFTRAVRDAQTAVSQAQAFESDPFEDGHEYSLKQTHPVLPLAHWLSAEAHHALQNHGARNEQLQLALATSTRVERGLTLAEGLALRSARFALDDRDPQAALARLQQLPAGVRRRTAALRIQLRAARLSNLPDQALDVARALAKHGALSQQAAQSLRRSLAIDKLRQAADATSLLRSFDQLDNAEKALTDVVCAAAAALRELSERDGQAARAQRDHDRLSDAAHAQLIARGWLTPLLTSWATHTPAQRTVLARLAPWAFDPAADAHSASSANDGVNLLEQLLNRTPGDANLSFLCAQVFAQRKLWGKAAQAFAVAAPSLQDRDSARMAWLSLAQLAEQKGDAAAAQAALKKAAQS